MGLNICDFKNRISVYVITILILNNFSLVKTQSSELIENKNISSIENDTTSDKNTRTPSFVSDSGIKIQEKPDSNERPDTNAAADNVLQLRKGKDVHENEDKTVDSAHGDAEDEEKGDENERGKTARDGESKGAGHVSKSIANYSVPDSGGAGTIEGEADPRQDDDGDKWTRLSWLMELFDYHNWDDRYFLNTSRSCNADMTIYLEALRNGSTWAAKIYDASGRYNGQFFFGNDLWLGSSSLCQELQLKMPGNDSTLLETPPFSTSFSVARIRIALGDYTPQIRTILMGVCMPASCSEIDLKRILGVCAEVSEKIAREKLVDRGGQMKGYNLTEEDKVQMKVVLVRSVPGSYSIWNDVKFYILGGVGFCVLVIMTVASIYEVYINKQNNKMSTMSNGKDVEMENNNTTRNGAVTNEEGTFGNGIGPEGSRVKGIGTSINGNGTHEGFVNGNGTSATRDGVHVNSNGSHAGTEELHAKGDEDFPAKRKCKGKLGTGILSQMLLSFSALSNTEKIMKTEESSEDAINCIHGLRFLSLAWVIMVHTYLQVFTVADNKTLRTVTERNFFYQTVGNASYSVDTFFFISGLLVTFLYSKALEGKRRNKLNRVASAGSRSGGHLEPNCGGECSVVHLQKYAYVNGAMAQTNGNNSNLEQFQIKFTRHSSTRDLKDNCVEFLTLLLYRFIRLTPAYLFVIGVNELVLRYSYNNSVFEPSILDHLTCEKYWWRNILYINNLFPQNEMCMLWSWYMANDTQFYIIGIILLLISKRHFKISVSILTMLLLSSWLTTGYISIANNYRAKIQEPFEMFDQLYDKPWSRLGPYLVGMITGWFLWKMHGRIVLPTWSVVLGWPSALAVMGSIIYGMRDGYLELWPTAFYVSIGHTAWSVAVAWVVICCVSHRGGLVSRFLSYRGALPLSRLAYCAYLVHPTILMLSTYQMDGPVHLHNGIVLIIYAGVTVMSYLMSYAISVAFEAPVVRLLKINFNFSTNGQK